MYPNIDEENDEEEWGDTGIENPFGILTTTTTSSLWLQKQQAISDKGFWNFRNLYSKIRIYLYFKSELFFSELRRSITPSSSVYFRNYDQITTLNKSLNNRRAFNYFILLEIVIIFIFYFLLNF